MIERNTKALGSLAISGVLFAGLTAAILYGCGGGGGGSSSTSGGTSGNRPPFAAAPTCNNAIVRQSNIRVSAVGANTSQIQIPSTSVENPTDFGTRAHTNHLISLSTSHPVAGGISGFNPSQIATAYGLPNYKNLGTGAIAIVDAYNDPNALNDFNVFANQYGLPTESSTTATATTNSVFQVVYATGRVPGNDGGWAQEMAIDIEWAHAMAPMAKIYLVEAASSNFSDIMAAVRVAKALPNVKEVSTSFGGTETACYYVDYDSAFLQSGVAFLAASGDSAGVRNFPALSSNVIAVGGTTLDVDPLGDWLSESVWKDEGCGPSGYEPRPVFQDSLYSTIGLYRGGVDVVAVADPSTGVAVYDSFAYEGVNGWFVAGGTSVACPIVAGIINGSGLTFASSQALDQKLYSLAGSSSVHSITSGSAGGFAAGSPWSFSSGIGSPNGLGPSL